jgi:hypothetical protein
LNKRKEMIKKKIYSNNRKNKIKIIAITVKTKKKWWKKKLQEWQLKWRTDGGRETKPRRREEERRGGKKRGQGFWNLKEGWVRAKEKEPHIKVWFGLG